MEVSSSNFSCDAVNSGEHADPKNNSFPLQKRLLRLGNMDKILRRFEPILRETSGVGELRGMSD